MILFNEIGIKFLKVLDSTFNISGVILILQIGVRTGENITLPRNTLSCRTRRAGLSNLSKERHLWLIVNFFVNN